MLKRYIKEQLILRQARRWLKANPDQAERLTAQAMFHLNRRARRLRTDKQPIYDIKNRLVRHFYQAGCCRSARLHEQTFYCYNCDGSGVHWTGGDCYRCYGSGIYRQVTLYQFIFDIQGQTFVWHQPDHLVDWPVELVDSDPRPFREGDRDDYESISPEISTLYKAVVYEYLRAAGIDGLPKPTSLRFALWWLVWIDSGLSEAWFRIRRRVRLVRDEIRSAREAMARLWHFAKTGRMPDPEPESMISEDEIPF